MRAHGLAIPPVKKPMCSRFSIVLAFGAWFSTVQAQELPATLDEDELVAHALERAPLRESLEGSITTEVGRAQSAGAYANPQLVYMREQTAGPVGTAEDYLTLAQVVDLGNRRGLQRSAGETRVRAAEQRAQATRLEIASEARLRFHQLLQRQGRIAALEGWLAHIEQALTIVTRREQRGDAAPYDRRRLERERSVASGRLESERAHLAQAGARAVAISGLSGGALRARGSLLPESDPIAEAELRTKSETRPDLLALDARVHGAQLERRAAARWWAPDLRLEGGWKGVAFNSQGRSDGFLLSAMLSVPLWDQARGAALSASGQARAAYGERARISGEVAAELSGAHAQAVRLRRAAIEFRRQTSELSSDLMRIASAGYEGGELGLLELLDAYRGAAEDALTALDMEFAAREARIKLDQMSGVGLP
jgi:cobalt-zinc-cadmium efflux system outer membrane protein